MNFPKHLEIADGELPDGIEFAGTIHKVVKYRQGLLRDDMNLLAEMKKEFGDDISEYDSPIMITSVTHSRRLVKLGDIPAESLTPQMLAQNLTSKDFAYLMAIKQEQDGSLEEDAKEVRKSERTAKKKEG